MDRLKLAEHRWSGRRGSLHSLADRAYKLLEEKIVMLELAPGEIYTEKNLANLLGLGRTPIRDAVLRLERDQLLTVIPRQGVMILPLDFERDLLGLDLRDVVERLVVKRATELATTMERRRLFRMADEMEKAAETKDVLAFTRLDNAFHDFVNDCARQPFAAKVLEPLHCLARRAGTILFQLNFDREIHDAAKVHFDLMRAIAGGEVDQALAAFENVIERSRRVIEELAEAQDY